MKTNIKNLIVLFIFLLAASEIQAQYGYGGGGYGYGGGGYGNNYGGGYGRGRSSIPQAGPVETKAPEPLTAAQIVDAEIPAIAETLGLDEFEKAVLSTTLKKYVQERIELQILKLPNEKMKEAYIKITKNQDKDLKAGLPIDKYDAFVKMQKEGVAKMKKQYKKDQKRKKKKKKSKE